MNGLIEATKSSEGLDLAQYNDELNAQIKKLKEDLLQASQHAQKHTRAGDSIYALQHLIYCPQGSEEPLCVCEEFRKKCATMPLFGSIESRIRTVSKEVFTFLRSGRKITLFTGCPSPSLIGILGVAHISALGSRPALVPTGMLLEHNIVPMSGELGYGIHLRGFNQTGISCVVPAEFYRAYRYANSNVLFNLNSELKIFKEDNSYSGMNSLISDGFISRVKIAVLRLAQFGNLNKPDKDLIRTKLGEALVRSVEIPINRKWESHSRLLGEVVPKTLGQVSLDPSQIQRGQIVSLWKSLSDSEPVFGMVADVINDTLVCVLKDGRRRALVGRVITYQTEDLDKLANPLPTKSPADLAAISRKIQGNHEILKECLQLLETTRPVELDVKEKSLVSAPFPVVWGTTTATQAIARGDSEVVIPGIQVLGKDMQLAFTSAEQVKRLQDLVGAIGVQVFSFDAAAQIIGRQKDFIPDFDFVG